MGSAHLAAPGSIFTLKDTGWVQGARRRTREKQSQKPRCDTDTWGTRPRIVEILIFYRLAMKLTPQVPELDGAIRYPNRASVN